MTKRCAICRRPLVRRPKEDRFSFELRQCCSHRCGGVLSSRARRWSRHARRCPICRQPLVRRANERAWNWRIRKLCSRRCANVNAARVLHSRPRLPRTGGWSSQSGAARYLPPPAEIATATLAIRRAHGHLPTGREEPDFRSLIVEVSA